MKLTNLLTLFTNNRLFVVMFSILSLTAFYGCNDNDEQEDEIRRQEEAYNRQLAADTLIIKDYIATHNIPNVMRSPYKSGLFYTVQTPGTGDSATLGKTVVTHYTLTNLKGDTLDTSRKPRTGQSTIQPLTFILGRSNIIPGFQEGVLLMRVGQRSTFFLPSGLAYGTQVQDKIPANSVLIFDIELLEVK